MTIIEATLICYNKGYELNESVFLAALPSKGDIITLRGLEYEVQYKSFNAESGISNIEPKVEIIVKIQ